MRTDYDQLCLRALACVRIIAGSTVQYMCIRIQCTSIYLYPY